MTDLQLRCFGSVVVYNPEDSYCSVCPVRVECEKAVISNRLAIAKEMKAPVFEDSEMWAEKKPRAARVRKKKVETIASPAAPAPVVSADIFSAMNRSDLPKKVHAEVVRWVTKAIDLAALSEGRNPFDGVDGVNTAQMIVEVALRSSTLPTKRQLVGEIITSQTASGGKVWTNDSVSSNVNIVAGALAACGYKIVENI